MCTVGRGMRVRSCDMVDTEVLTHDVCVGEAKEARLTNKESVSDSFSFKDILGTAYCCLLSTMLLFESSYHHCLIAFCVAYPMTN
jgi:hypothetical protein